MSSAYPHSSDLNPTPLSRWLVAVCEAHMSLDPELTVTRLDGEDVSLHSLVEGQKTVLVFLRHFG